MSALSATVDRIDKRTEDMATTLAQVKTTQGEQGRDIAALIKHQAEQDCEIGKLQLANARLNGQIDMLKYLVTLLGVSGIATLIYTFAPK